ncbi:MAG: hypothetical protein HQL98_13405 [Magnetococcales bacterium]|nr:hypothetical protein [Magnetococcales bacterium]
MDHHSPGHFIHPTAIVDDPIEIGNGSHVWHFSHLMSHCVIGEACNIGQNVVIEKKVRIGNRCRIMNNVTVHEQVTLEDDVFCGPGAVFTNVINPRAHIPRKHEFKPTLVRQGCTIGANATIVCGVVLGRFKTHTIPVPTPEWASSCFDKTINHDEMKQKGVIDAGTWSHRILTDAWLDTIVQQGKGEVIFQSPAGRTLLLYGRTPKERAQAVRP